MTAALTRVCPVTDAICRYGVDCVYSIDRYHCRDPFTEKPMAKWAKAEGTAADTLTTAAATFTEKQKTYKNNYVQCAAAMLALFPKAPQPATIKDHARLQMFMMIIGKLSRYAVNFDAGGHQDSIHDAIVYAAMLEAIDAGPDL